MNPNRKGIKKNKILSADDMILYTENPEDTTHTHTHRNCQNKSVNPGKLQDKKSIYKNKLYFYILTMNYLQRCKTYTNLKQKNNKILRNKFNQGGG